MVFSLRVVMAHIVNVELEDECSELIHRHACHTFGQVGKECVENQQKNAVDLLGDFSRNYRLFVSSLLLDLFSDLFPHTFRLNHVQGSLTDHSKHVFHLLHAVVFVLLVDLKRTVQGESGWGQQTVLRCDQIQQDGLVEDRVANVGNWENFKSCTIENFHFCLLLIEDDQRVFLPTLLFEDFWTSQGMFLSQFGKQGLRVEFDDLLHMLKIFLL